VGAVTLIAILCLLLVGMVAIASRVFGGSWLAPIAFFPGIWFVYLSAPLVLAPHFYLSASAILIITAIIVFWFIGSMLALAMPLLSAPLPRSGGIQVKENVCCSRALVFCGLVSIVSFVYLTLMPILDLLGPMVPSSALGVLEGVEDLARDSAFKRYREFSVPGLVQNVMVMLTYTACLAAGSMLACTRPIRISSYLWAVGVTLPLVALVGHGVVQNTKATVLYAVVLYLSGYALAEAGSKDVLRRFFRLSYLVIGIVLVIAAGSLFLWMQQTRYSENPLTMADAYNLFLVYAVGYLGGFSYWLDHYYPASQTTGGSQTFFLVFKILGLRSSTTLPVQQPKMLYRDLETNVNTAFADLMLDFGLLGLLFFLSGCAFLMSICYRAFVRGSLLPIAILALFYASSLWSFTTSIAKYSTIVGAVVIFQILIMRLPSGSR